MAVRQACDFYAAGASENVSEATTGDGQFNHWGLDTDAQGNISQVYLSLYLFKLHHRERDRLADA
jgi:hypothetical protein